MAVLLALSLSAEVLRARVASLNRIFMRFFGPLLKETESGGPTGVPFFLAGLLASLVLYDRAVALAGLIILAAGDPAAAMAGRKWGKTRLGAKSLEGTLAFIAAALLGGALLAPYWPVPPLGIYAVGAVIGAAAELVPWRLNDNLTIPLAAGLGMELLVRAAQ